MSSVLVAAVRQTEPSTATPRLLVTRQDPRTRVYSAVGVLSCAHNRFTFGYLPRTTLPGFSDVGRTYSSASLFPLFSQRVMDPRRPDRQQWLQWLGLDGDPDVFEVLAHSGGRRVSDSIELIRIPEPDGDGRFVLPFLVHGVRHLRTNDTDLEERLQGLQPGDPLGLLPHEDNPYNPRALFVTNPDRPLGYVPEPLLTLIDDVRTGGELMLRVLRSNGPEAGDHLRLLVEASAQHPEATTLVARLLEGRTELVG